MVGSSFSTSRASIMESLKHCCGSETLVLYFFDSVLPISVADVVDDSTVERRQDDKRAQILSLL